MASTSCCSCIVLVRVLVDSLVGPFVVLLVDVRPFVVVFVEVVGGTTGVHTLMVV